MCALTGAWRAEGRGIAARREPCGVWAVRACGARERERREAERAEAGESGAERAASPMVLHCVVGE